MRGLSSTKNKTILICVTCFLALSYLMYIKFRSKNKTVNVLNIDNKTYEYVEYRPSENGRYYFTPRGFGKDQPYARIVSLEVPSKKIFFHKIIKKTESMAYDFRLNKDGLHSYFIVEKNNSNWTSRNLVTVSYGLLDENFNEVNRSFQPKPSNELDLHDVIVNSRGNHIFIYYVVDKKTNLTETEIRELDEAGKIVFKWSSKNHFKNEKKQNKKLDYLHANSVFEDIDGGLVVSFREISTIIKIQYPTGKILWSISNKDWKFVDDDQNGFSFQHAAQLMKNGNLLMYDNGGRASTDISRAVEYRLDFVKKEAYLVWQKKAESPFLHRRNWGGVQRLSNGNTLISWGSLEAEWQDRFYSKVPIFTEVNRRHKKVRELLSRDGLGTYRVHFFETGN